MDATFEKVKALIVNEFGVASETITPTTVLTDLGVDSLAALEFVFLLEDLFHVTMTDEVDLRGGKVQDVVDVVNRALAARPRAVAA